MQEEGGWQNSVHVVAVLIFGECLIGPGHSPLSSANLSLLPKVILTFVQYPIIMAINGLWVGTLPTNFKSKFCSHEINIGIPYNS